MVKEIGDQHQILTAAKIGFEGAARKQVVAIGNSHCLRSLPCDFEHILPIGRIDMCGRILFCRRDSEDAVAGSDIENFVCLAAFAEFGHSSWLQRRATVTTLPCYWQKGQTRTAG